MGEGSGLGSGRVESDFWSAISGRVNVLPGRVQEKWPVDNSGGDTGSPMAYLGEEAMVLVAKK